MDSAVAAGDLPKFRSELDRFAASAYLFGAVPPTQMRWNLLHLACWYDQPEVLRALLSSLSAEESGELQAAKDVVWDT
jgi:hypothetical protein